MPGRSMAAQEEEEDPQAETYDFGGQRTAEAIYADDLWPDEAGDDPGLPASPGDVGVRVPRRALYSQWARQQMMTASASTAVRRQARKALRVVQSDVESDTSAQTVPMRTRGRIVVSRTSAAQHPSYRQQGRVSRSLRKHRTRATGKLSRAPSPLPNARRGAETPGRYLLVEQREPVIPTEDEDDDGDDVHTDTEDCASEAPSVAMSDRLPPSRYAQRPPWVDIKANGSGGVPLRRAASMYEACEMPLQVDRYGLPVHAQRPPRPPPRPAHADGNDASSSPPPPPSMPPPPLPAYPPRPAQHAPDGVYADLEQN